MHRSLDILLVVSITPNPFRWYLWAYHPAKPRSYSFGPINWLPSPNDRANPNLGQWICSTTQELKISSTQIWDTASSRSASTVWVLALTFSSSCTVGSYAFDDYTSSSLGFDRASLKHHRPRRQRPHHPALPRVRDAQVLWYTFYTSWPVLKFLDFLDMNAFDVSAQSLLQCHLHESLHFLDVCLVLLSLRLQLLDLLGQGCHRHNRFHQDRPRAALIELFPKPAASIAS